MSLNEVADAVITTARLLSLVEALRAELQPGRPASAPARLDSALERELGFDSLSRAELLLRIEREFGLHLPQSLLGNAETPRHFFDAIAAAAAAGDARVAGVATMTQVPVPAFAKSGDVGAAMAAPDALETLGEVLVWHGQHQPERVHLIFLDEQGSEQAGTEQILTFARLWREAQAVAVALQQRDVSPGDSVALMLPTCPAFFPCFLGILLAGAVPVPIYPPARPSQIEDHLRRHVTILANARARLLIATAEVALPARLLCSQVATLRGVVQAADLLSGRGVPVSVPISVPMRADALALLQYTSGSTGNPKGVMLTHGQLLANIRAMAQAANIGGDDVFVSWLPLYHDMGLICAWLSSLVHGIPFVVMSPLSFLAAPERWLRAISRYRGTLSGAPNFAYELCLRRIDAEQMARLDLSSWRIAFNGAEPVNADTMARFAARFAPCGLHPQAIAPVYGMAECAVGLSFSLGQGLVVDRIMREAFVTGGRAEPIDATAGCGDVLRFVACGRPLPGYEIRIVDTAGAELPERCEGRLQFRGPSATAGYFHNPEASAQLVQADGWLDSGDYAYLAAGEVYPTGRAKDIIIKGGRNIYPQEIEEAVGQVSGIRTGCVAVFGSPDPMSGTERLVVVAEVRSADVVLCVTTCEALRQAVQDAVVGVLGMPADDVLISARRVVLKTSSGKIRRAASRELYESGHAVSAATAPRAVWVQVLRLLLAGVRPQLRRSVRAAVTWLRGAWAVAVFVVLAVPTWLAVAVLPPSTFGWRICRTFARLWLRIAGIRLTVAGMENISPSAAQVLVANHASYLDSIVLAAALPNSAWRFVAKRELQDHFVTRIFLQRLNCAFVERFDFQQGVADAARLTAEVGAGAALVFFPEGTFTRVPGLRPFRSGAFLIAAQNGAAVLPVALAGTRDVLRDGHWLPQPGAVRVTIMAPLMPEGADFSAALKLRDAARAAILTACGEPDLPG
jgi:1-acyl-sn-glycerol-3-phosphate acyltransferase